MQRLTLHLYGCYHLLHTEQGVCHQRLTLLHLCGCYKANAFALETEHIKSPQEVTLEVDRQPSTVVIVTTKGPIAATHIG